jgi:NAD(P)H-flavin reductase/hemoglobin-like flavoprotein
VIDVDGLKRSWAQVSAHGDQVALRFYSRLFVTVPAARQMFPLSMVGQRDRLVTALGHTVAHVDDLDRLVPYLEQLGRDHRRFGVLADHYGPVGDALLATLADFLGRDWTLELAQSWADAYALVARTMMAAADDDAARSTPAWWVAEVVDHERRTFDIAVVTVRLDQHYDYLPGQSMALETPFRPRVWRYFSPANAPRPDGSLELHVRRVPGGPVSSALVDRVQKGDVVHLGAPVGHRLTLSTAATVQSDLLMIAGGTGLAPLRAVVEQVAAQAAAGDRVRQVALFVGARTARELYDIDRLRALEDQHRWLTVLPVLANPGPGPGQAGLHRAEIGDVADVALRRRDRWLGDHDDYDVYVCGNDQMVAASVRLLATAGCAAERIHYEGFQGLGGDTFGLIERGTAAQ